ncbi:LmbE-like protein [Schizopora paradoxa]|uniref:N-acetylglucosaminylphosphatidylinositol deacetylase n=1 Tax=Schizopora paradoxa TaxID=27342 RepID=A0A0H2RYI0_9AGAM|nr:LmbE-like protein [Schizopora paradoxa]
MFSTPISWILGILIPFIYTLCCVPLSPHEFGGVSSNVSRVLLLTAHPDDECMFFAPTLLGLNNQVSKTSYELYSLCLSSGDADGLGDIRKQELGASLDVLGVAEDRRWVLDSPFKDNITQFWETEQIVEYVQPYITENRINIVLTFDEHGISSHPNHISLIRGASALLDEQRHLRGFALKTTNVAAKYTGQASAIWNILHLRLCALLNNYYASESCRSKESLTFISGLEGYATALRAMMRHKSQLVWFRWLYVAFSRYMWVNEWVEIHG